jgi:hypothetical protein
MHVYRVLQVHAYIQGPTGTCIYTGSYRYMHIYRVLQVHAYIQGPTGTCIYTGSYRYMHIYRVLQVHAYIQGPTGRVLQVHAYIQGPTGACIYTGSYRYMQYNTGSYYSLDTWISGQWIPTRRGSVPTYIALIINTIATSLVPGTSTCVHTHTVFPLTQAVAARDSMGKALYSSLFDWIVEKVSDVGCWHSLLLPN